MAAADALAAIEDRSCGSPDFIAGHESVIFANADPVTPFAESTAPPSAPAIELIPPVTVADTPAAKLPADIVEATLPKLEVALATADPGFRTKSVTLSTPAVAPANIIPEICVAFSFPVTTPAAVNAVCAPFIVESIVFTCA